MRTRQLTLLLALLLASQAGDAARIEFYEGTRATQNLEGTVPDMHALRKGVASMGWDNDEIKSVRLRWVAPGTRIRLFDSPSGSKRDDWLEIHVKKWKEEIIIDHLEPRQNDPWASSDYHSVQFHPQMVRPNPALPAVARPDLNGKVSRIEVDPGAAGSAPVEARIERCIYGKYRFIHKRGGAHEFKSQNSNYRVWFPDYSIKPDGSVNLTFKMDHIRGGYKDDYGNLRMAFNRDGVLTDTRVDITLRDAGQIRTSLAQAWSDIPDSARANKAVMISEASTKIAAELYALASDLTDSGGRKNFSSAIEKVMTDLGTALGRRGCIPEGPMPTWPTVR